MRSRSDCRALIGFRDGPAAIPEWWIEPLRQRERIESLAED
jgi:hypothetical protein